MVETPALIQPLGPAKRPSARAESPHDPASRAARQRRPDDAASRPRHVTAAGEYAIPRQETAAGPCPIGQAELEEFHALSQRRKEIDARRGELRRSFLDRLEQGAAVEPGRLQAIRRASDQCRPTFANLQELLGEEFILDLRRRLPTRKFVSLWVSASEEDVLEPGAEAIGESDETSVPDGSW
jgi:hypothetical protein